MISDCHSLEVLFCNTRNFFQHHMMSQEHIWRRWDQCSLALVRHPQVELHFQREFNLFYTFLNNHYFRTARFKPGLHSVCHLAMCFPVWRSESCTSSTESCSCAPTASRRVIVDNMAPNVDFIFATFLTNCLKTVPLHLWWKTAVKIFEDVLSGSSRTRHEPRAHL